MLKREWGSTRVTQSQLDERVEDKRKILQQHNFQEYQEYASDYLCLHSGTPLRIGISEKQAYAIIWNKDLYLSVKAIPISLL